MLSLLLLFLFLFFFWIVTRALLWVVYYFIIYLAVAHVAYLLLGNFIDFNGPVAFWVSRIVFLGIAFWLGGELRAFLARHPAISWVVALVMVGIVIFLLYQPLPYYYQPPVPRGFL